MSDVHCQGQDRKGIWTENRANGGDYSENGKDPTTYLIKICTPENDVVFLFYDSQEYRTKILKMRCSSYISNKWIVLLVLTPVSNELTKIFASD